MYKEAMSDAEECIRRDPTFVKGHIRRAAVLRAQGRYQEEVVALERAHGIDPSNADVITALATARSKAEVCVECGRTAVSLCGSCSMERYCSRECQTKRWAVHKRVCAGVAGDAASRGAVDITATIAGSTGGVAGKAGKGASAVKKVSARRVCVCRLE